MRRRAASGRALSATAEVQPHSRLHIKPRREGRLSCRLAEMKKQYLRTLEAQRQCVARSTSLSLLMKKMLAWSGRLTPDELRAQQRKLATIHLQQQQLTLQQKSLMSHLAQLQAKQHDLVRELSCLVSPVSDEAQVLDINAFS